MRKKSKHITVKNGFSLFILSTKIEQSGSTFQYVSNLSDSLKTFLIPRQQTSKNIFFSQKEENYNKEIFLKQTGDYDIFHFNIILIFVKQ